MALLDDSSSERLAALLESSARNCSFPNSLEVIEEWVPGGSMPRASSINCDLPFAVDGPNSTNAFGALIFVATTAQAAPRISSSKMRVLRVAFPDPHIPLKKRSVSGVRAVLSSGVEMALMQNCCFNSCACKTSTTPPSCVIRINPDRQFRRIGASLKKLARHK